MSKTLLKRSMEMVIETPPKLSKKSSKATEKQQNTAKRHQKTKKDNNQVKRVVKPKFNIKQVQKRLNNEKDRTEDNVKRLLALDRSLQLNDETKELMLKRARAGHYVIPEKVEKEEEDIFTKEDFEKFEREYFCH